MKHKDPELYEIPFAVGGRYRANGRTFQINKRFTRFCFDHGDKLTYYTVQEIPDRNGQRWDVSQLRLWDLVQEGKIKFLVYCPKLQKWH